MSLYEKWNKLLEDQEGEQEFWKEFLLKEKKTYEVLLGDIKNPIYSILLLHYIKN